MKHLLNIGGALRRDVQWVRNVVCATTIILWAGRVNQWKNLRSLIMNLGEDKTLTLRVFQSFPDVNVWVIIHDLLFNCRFVGEPLSGRDHSCYSLIIFLVCVLILDTRKKCATNYRFTIIPCLAPFDSIMNALDNLRLLLNYIIWTVHHQLGLWWVVRESASVYPYSLIIGPDKLRWSDRIAHSSSILWFLGNFYNGLWDRRAADSARTTIGLLLLLTYSFFKIIHVVLANQIIHALWWRDSHPISLQRGEVIWSGIVSFRIIT